jgi:hypothetical protein
MIDIVIVRNDGFRTTPEYYDTWRCHGTYPSYSDDSFLPYMVIRPGTIKRNKFFHNRWARDTHICAYPDIIDCVLIIDTITKETVKTNTKVLAATLAIWSIK